MLNLANPVVSEVMEKILKFRHYSLSWWNQKWSAYATSLKPGQLAHLCSLTELYTVGWPTSSSHLDNPLKWYWTVSKMVSGLFHLRNSAGYGLSNSLQRHFLVYCRHFQVWYLRHQTFVIWLLKNLSFTTKCLSTHHF